MLRKYKDTFSGTKKLEIHDKDLRDMKSKIVERISALQVESHGG